MNLVDLLIILLLFAAAARAVHAGILELCLSFAGVVTGLLIGSRIAQLIVVHISGTTGKVITIGILELGFAGGLWWGALLISRRHRPRPQRLNISLANEIIGGVVGVLFTLLVIWLAASGLSTIPKYSIGHNVKHSFIIRHLNEVLPPPPDLMARLEKIVSPNGFPDVFLGLEPSHITISPTSSVSNQMILADEKSVVRIRGLSCGQLVYGSGFVVDKNLVITNAHVVAGSKRPQVVDAHKTYSSTPIWFDPKLDVAILRVNGLADAPLSLSSGTLPSGAGAATLGFPGGNVLVAQDAAVIDRVTATGRSIYNRGLVDRDIYELQANVQDGDSGGPLLATDGSVAGIVFARALSQNNLAYALAIDPIKPLIAQAKAQNKTIDTSYCTD